MRAPVPVGRVAVTLLLLSGLTACAPPDSVRTGPVRRIVSLVPTATETLFALGAGDRVIARSSWCDYPPEAAALPALGDALTLNAEAVVGLHPDLIFVGSDIQVQSLGAVAETVRVERVLAESRGDVEEAVWRLALLTGREADGKRILARIDDAFAAARKRNRGRPALRVLFVVQQEPLLVAGRGSHVDEILAALGVTNIAGDLKRPWAALSPESLVARDPEVILDASEAPRGDGVARLEMWKLFSTVSAVRDGRVLRVEEPATVRPGPRLPLAIEAIEKLVRGAGR